MVTKAFYTVPELAKELGQPIWKVRRIIDKLDGIPRGGLYRMVPTERVKEVAERLGIQEAVAN